MMILDIFRSGGKSSNAGEDDVMSKAGNQDKDEDDRVGFSAYAEQSKLPPMEKWPDDIATIVTPSQRAAEIEYELPDNNTSSDFVPSLPMHGEVVRFDGPSFQGKIASRMRDVPLPPHKGNRMTNADYFDSRSRMYQWTVQGKFKRRIRFDEVTTGQEFGRPFRNTPSSTMVEKGLDMLKHKLPETFEW